VTHLTDCRTSFETLELASWPGLPARLAEAEVIDALQIERAHHTFGPIGEPMQWLSWLAAPTRRYADGWRVWVDNHEVVCWEGINPTSDTGYPIADLNSLPPPDLTLPARLGPVVLPEGELVYAERGLAIRINPADQQLLGVIGFAPTSVTNYRSMIRPVQRAPRLLPRGSDE
jgi:hypothetical protein